MIRPDPILIHPSEAYPQAQRWAHAESHVLLAAELHFLSQTSCSQIARTYGIAHLTAELKRLKGRLFPEFACNGEGK